MDQTRLDWLLFSGLLSIAISLNGLRKGSLSVGGAWAAVLVGFVHMAAAPRFGVMLILFFLSSSKLTKFKAGEKAKLEADFKIGGQRSATQVLANSLGGALLAVAVRLVPKLLKTSGFPWATFLDAAFLGHYSCCTADTWASEVGILSKTLPRLVTTWKAVPRGTNGAISLLGSIMSAGGGLFMGASFAVLKAAMLTRGAGTVLGWKSVLLGLAGGVLGSAIDSLLGATLQYSAWSKARQLVVSSPSASATHICGLDILSNSGVNMTSAALTSFLVGGLAVALS